MKHSIFSNNTLFPTDLFKTARLIFVDKPRNDEVQVATETMRSPELQQVTETRAEVTEVIETPNAMETLKRSETFRFAEANSMNIKGASANTWSQILNELKKEMGTEGLRQVLPELAKWAVDQKVQNYTFALGRLKLEGAKPATVAKRPTVVADRPDIVIAIDMNDLGQVRQHYDELRGKLREIKEVEGHYYKLKEDMKKTGDAGLAVYIDEDLDKIRSLTKPYNSKDDLRYVLSKLEEKLR